MAAQLARAEERLGLGAGNGKAKTATTKTAPAKIAPAKSGAGAAGSQAAAPEPGAIESFDGGIVLRRASLDDVPGIARIMADFVAQGVLLPRPVSELYQCIREFHVAERAGEVVACAALRLLWDDLGEVRSLAVRPDHHGSGLGARLVQRVLDDARTLDLPRVIALTREVGFFERCGFGIVSRDTLPRKVWTDCVRCPRRHACDEVAVVLDLKPGATAAAAAAAASWVLPIPPPLQIEPALPVIHS